MIGEILMKLTDLYNYFLRKYKKKLLGKCGDNVYIGKNCIMTYANIFIGDDVYIGPNACIQSAHGKVIIGNHVMFGPGVNIHGGNHEFNCIGKYMKSINKQPDSDGVVRIEDDVWIGANAIILAGVNIGKGSIIGAGSIVTKDVPPYSIYTGAPPLKIRRRFSDEEIREHEQILKEANV